MKKLYWVILISISACSSADDNDTAKFNPTTGNPINCRAFVQFAIDEYRKGAYTADDTFRSLERNCGSNGYSWKNLREK